MIRDVTMEDKASYFEMARAFYEDTPAALHGMNRRNCERTFAECLKKGPYVRTLMIGKDRPVGFAMLSFTWSNESGGFVVLLEELYICPDERGKGYGKRFLQWMEQEYPQATRFRLEVTAYNNDAKALYRADGYEDLAYEQMVKDR